MTGSWPHAPIHKLGDSGAYIVTAGTLRKERLFADDMRLDFLQQTLLETCAEYDWQVQAWACFANHYHFVASTKSDPNTLRTVVSKLHTLTARHINELDGVEGRKVWFQYWDTHLTFERSYLARLNYVHHNPVKHGLVNDAREYRWCSAAWFERTANPAFYRTVTSFKTDSVNVRDDF